MRDTKMENRKWKMEKRAASCEASVAMGQVKFSCGRRGETLGDSEVREGVGEVGGLRDETLRGGEVVNSLAAGCEVWVFGVEMRVEAVAVEE